MPLGWISAGIGAINAVEGLFGGGGSSSSGAAAKSTQQQYDIQNRSMNLAESQWSWQTMYDAKLSDLINNPSQMHNIPGYDQAIGDAVQATGRQYAAGGRNLTPGMEEAQIRAGAGVASDFFMKQEQFLASVAGLNVNPASAYGTASGAGAQGFGQTGTLQNSVGQALGPGGAISNLWNKFTGIGGTTTTITDPFYGYNPGSAGSGAISDLSGMIPSINLGG
jgi:hypothetical protein